MSVGPKLRESSGFPGSEVRADGPIIDMMKVEVAFRSLTGVNGLHLGREIL